MLGWEPAVWDHALAVVVGLALPLYAALGEPARMRGATFEPREKIATYWVNGAALALLASLAIAATLARGDGLGALGLAGARGHDGALRGSLWILAIVVAVYLLDLAHKLTTPRRRAETAERLRERTPFLPTTRRELAHSLAMVTGAAVGEEILYRGFLVAYLVSVCGDAAGCAPMAILVPAAIFGLSHRYQGAAAVVHVVVLAAAFGWFFVRTGTLWPLIVLHFAIDLTGCTIALLLARGSRARAAAA